jgi:hypothetical protein
LIWVTRYHMIHYSGPVRLGPDRTAWHHRLLQHYYCHMTSLQTQRRCVYRAAPYQRPSPWLRYFVFQVSHKLHWTP